MTMIPPRSAPSLAIVGTTASGKSALAMGLARVRGDVELMSVDSMQVYRGMDIGTAKPTPAEQAEVRHHLLDLVDPWEPFEVHSFQAAAREALADIAARGRRAVLVGGTGLYLRAVVDGFEIPGRFPEVAAELDTTPDTPDETAHLHARLAELDPAAAHRMDPNNRRRVLRALEVTLGSGQPFSSYGPGVDAYPATPVQMVGIRLPQPVVAERIAHRYEQQMEVGFLAEVRRLAAGPPLSHTAAQALGYRELLTYLRAEETEGTGGGPGQPSGGARGDLDAALSEAVRRTRKFARRQRAWFRRDPRITWLDADTDPLAVLPNLLTIAERLWT